MRNGVIGIVIGLVLGIVFGATLIAPRLSPAPGTPEAVESLTEIPPSPQPESEAAPEPEPAPLPVARASVQWNMASAYAGSLPQLGTLAKRLQGNIWTVSEGTLEIRFHEPGTLVPALEIFDAVASGAIDAAFSSPHAWADRVPALQLFASVPFGPAPGEYLAWVYFGGGRELADELYHRHNIHGIPCGLIAPAASGWFREEIRTVDDLDGLRMRFTGLGAKVMARLGVETLPLAGGTVFRALESGAIDAAEFSMPAVDLRMGFHEMAKHYYFPGWHQPSTLFDLLINLDNWDLLKAVDKARLEIVCGDNVRYGLAEGEALQFDALRELSSRGVLIHRWPTAILEALEEAWREVVAEEAAADADFARAWESLTAFREDYSIWRELGYP